MSDDLFTTYERLETCRRTEVTLENLHLLAQHFGGKAVYGEDPSSANISKRGPHLDLPGKEWGIEVGAWIDERGSRWNAEPLSQGWCPEGTYKQFQPIRVEIDR